MQARAPHRSGAAALTYARLEDRNLSARERISWLIDEVPHRVGDISVSSLTAHEGFILNMVDGQVSFADIMDIVGRRAEETAETLCGLLLRGLITTQSTQG